MGDTDNGNKRQTTGETNSSGSVQNCVTAKMPSQRKPTYYNMNHKNRGLALIFNQEKFESYLPLEKRSGTNQDVACMKQLLIGLGLQVFVYRNNRFAALERRIREAAKYDHTNYDCFVMVVLTHGDENDILYANDSSYSAANLWIPFTADSCPTLAGKPKLFFIQACRGQKSMLPTDLETVQADTASNASYKIPCHSDFLFFYSSCPGYVSFLNTKTGSWFIQVLCRIFEKNVYEYDILTLLTLVIQSVALDCKTSLLNKNSLTGQQKQVPCVITSLTRLLKFEKKINQISYPALLKNVKFTKSKPMPDDAIENKEVKKSIVSSQETRTRNQNLEEETVKYPAQVKTWDSYRFCYHCKTAY